MIIPGVHPFGPVGPVWGAYSIRPYTGYVHSLRAPGMIIRPLSGASGYPGRGVLHTPSGRHHRWRMCHRGTCIRYVRRHSGPEARLVCWCGYPCRGVLHTPHRAPPSVANVPPRYVHSLRAPSFGPGGPFGLLVRVPVRPVGAPNHSPGRNPGRAGYPCAL